MIMIVSVLIMSNSLIRSVIIGSVSVLVVSIGDETVDAPGEVWSGCTILGTKPCGRHMGRVHRGQAGVSDLQHF